MARVNAWTRTHKLAAGLILAVVALAALGIAFVGIAGATDKSVFCGSACHEMSPFHEAWAQGPHRNVACVECHVDSGETARLSHKFSALKEVAAHVARDTSFPRSAPAIVPNARCIRCHQTITVNGLAKFDHAAHATGRECASCHPTAGHDVTTAALQKAGILGAARPAAASANTSRAVVNGGAADLTGHVTVVCSRCHTMSKTACSACHQPGHKPRGECTSCHKPGPKFVFAHPKGGVDCTMCHKPPATHGDKTDCTSCHTSPGETWMYGSHSKTSDCASCHARPDQHRTGTCSDCHKQPGVSWAFSHPGIGASCASCHNRPSSHSSGQCSQCHRQPGRSWAFAHAPIPGGQHSSRSFACTNCHPNGYTTHTCIKCHDSSSGG